MVYLKAHQSVEWSGVVSSVRPSHPSGEPITPLKMNYNNQIINAENELEQSNHQIDKIH